MSEPTKEQWREAQALRNRFTREKDDDGNPYFDVTALARIIADVRTQATNDALNAVRKCEQRSGTCVMVHSILNKEHPEVCDAENCDAIRAMKVPT